MSIVEIRTDVTGGTGFIINRDGLIVTNKHVVEGTDRVIIRTTYQHTIGASVVGEHASLDLAYIQIADRPGQFDPIAIGDSDAVRVGENVIVIGFPIADTLGSEPTVSQGIVSAHRAGLIQTDAPVNPGNSGGPMLDQFGNVIGVVVSRVDESGGQDIAGIGFAIPINEVTTDLEGQVTPGNVLPTPTPFPTIGPTPDLEATRAAIEAVDAQRRLEEQATRTSIEAQEEAKRYAASLEATRVAELPTATPTPTLTLEPTPTPVPPTPTPTPHPVTYCPEWEAMVLDWIREGNVYDYYEAPSHPQLSAERAHGMCITAFPSGQLGGKGLQWATVGTGKNQLLPGTYEYRTTHGGNRVIDQHCNLRLNDDDDVASSIGLTYGEPFQFTFYTYHGDVQLWCNRYVGSALYRIGD